MADTNDVKNLVTKKTNSQFDIQTIELAIPITKKNVKVIKIHITNKIRSFFESIVSKIKIAYLLVIFIKM